MGEMANHEPVQLAHVKGVAMVVLVADNKQFMIRPRLAGLYLTAVTVLSLT